MNMQTGSKHKCVRAKACFPLLSAIHAAQPNPADSKEIWITLANACNAVQFFLYLQI